MLTCGGYLSVSRAEVAAWFGGRNMALNWLTEKKHIASISVFVVQ